MLKDLYIDRFDLYIDKGNFGDYLKVECGNTTSGSFNMAALCACYSRLIFKNIRTVSQLTKNSLKSKSYWARHHGSKVLISSSSCWEKSCIKNNKTCNSVIQSLSGIQRICRIHTSGQLREIREIKVPQLAESLSEGDIRWDRAVGDQVAEDEVICEVETDKTSVPIHAPAAGVIEELLVEDGATVTPGMSICKINVGATSGAPAPKKEAAAPSDESQPEVSAPQSTPSPEVSSAIPTTPPPVPPKPSAPASSTPVSSIKIPITPQPLPPGQAESMITGSRTETRVKMNRMRQRIAQRLKEAQNTNAMLTTFNEIDMSNIMEMRAQYKDAFLKKHNMKLGFMSAFVKASAYALQDQPIVNAVIDEGDIVYRDYIDISVAVATPKGLVVPVIRNLEKMNYADIEKAINALGEKARTGSLAIEDMDGGTFTISNGGVFGSLYGTPIINPPQSAILGMHGIFDRPVAIKGKVEIRPMMYVALTYDHRLIDGREAVFFLRKIKSAVEDPRIMLLDL